MPQTSTLSTTAASLSEPPLRPLAATAGLPRTGWLAYGDLLCLALAAPLLLFPRGALPWVGLALIALGWGARRLALGRFSVPTALDVPIALMLLMTLVGYAISADRALSAPKVWGVVLGFAAFYTLANGLHSEARVIWAARVLALGTAVVAVLGLFATDWANVRLLPLPWLYGLFPSLLRGLPNSGLPRASDLANPREVGATMGLLLPACAAPLLFGRDPWLRRLAVPAVALSAVVLLLSQSVQALGGAALGLLLLLAWRSRRWLLLVPLGVIVAAAGLLIYGPARAAVLALSIDNPIGIGVALRLDIWSRTLAMLRDMPYTGIGLNTFPLIQSGFYPGYLIGPEPHAHNLYLQTALDLGLPGLAALLWALVAWLAVVVRRYRAAASLDYRVVLVGLLAGVASFGAHGLFDAVTLGAKPTVALWIMLAMAAAPLGRVAPSTRARVATQWLPLVALVVLTLLSILIWPASFFANLGSLQAHQALVTAESGQPVPVVALSSARGWLQRALALDPDRPFALDLLARGDGWLGDPGPALAALRARVALDLREPVCTYYPSECLLRQIEGRPSPSPMVDLQQVYGQWIARFPTRAESYALQAVLLNEYQADRPGALTLLSDGLAQGAQPRPLLEAYRSQLSSTP